MAKKPNKVVATPTINLAKLGEIAKATLAGGFVYISADEVAPLVTAELVETNPAMTDESGNIAARATPKGIDTVNTETNTATAPIAAATPAPVAGRPTFEIDDYVPSTHNKRGGGGGKGAELYPFDALAVGKSFHVPNTADKPDVAKSLASTVSSATARYAEGTGEFETVKVPVYQLDAEGKRVKVEGSFVKIGEKDETREIMKKTRVFRVQRVGDEDPRGPGARVIRDE